MVCVCGHSGDRHEEVDGSFEELVLGECMECPCKEFCEDMDRDEVEKE